MITALQVICAIAAITLACVLFVLSKSKTYIARLEAWLDESRREKALATHRAEELDDAVGSLKIELLEAKSRIQTQHESLQKVLPVGKGIKFYFDLTQPESEINALRDALEFLQRAEGYTAENIVLENNSHGLGISATLAREFCLRAEKEFCRQGRMAIIALAAADLEQCIERMASASQPK